MPTMTQITTCPPELTGGFSAVGGGCGGGPGGGDVPGGKGGGVVWVFEMWAALMAAHAPMTAPMIPPAAEMIWTIIVLSMSRHH
jgi:hypothetical protein